MHPASFFFFLGKYHHLLPYSCLYLKTFRVYKQHIITPEAEANPIWINAEHTGKEFALPVSKANILFLGTWWDWWNCVCT